MKGVFIENMQGANVSPLFTPAAAFDWAGLAHRMGEEDDQPRRYEGEAKALLAFFQEVIGPPKTFERGKAAQKAVGQRFLAVIRRDWPELLKKGTHHVR